ncbi:MAG TPA: hypothetical protein VD907_04120 [Verrucomicrobiae bacterium]|nr:hypothetical protein [Verrucomicrobiae bacterium]
MAGKSIITINGQAYDATTGLAVSSAEDGAKPHAPRPAANKIVQDIAPSVRIPEQPVVKRSSATAAAVHSRLDRSRTLYRAALKKPTSNVPPVKERPRVHMTRSPQIQKFSSQPISEPAKPTVKQAPAAQPALQRKFVHHSTTAQKTPKQPISSRAIKEELLREHLEKAPTKRAIPERRFFDKHPKVLSVATSALALVLLGGYLTYINVPNLSIRVAAAQAGIDAKMPEYQPDGYSFNGPPEYAQGQVTIRYAANTSNQGYIITQKESDWDSQAVLDNYVLQESNGAYNIHSVQGLTIYTFGNKAVWVNGGLLHEIDYGDSPLSYNQIEHIAASM